MGDDNYDNYYDESQEYEQKYCMVYDKEDFFTVLVQLLLAVMALGSLYIKRMREKPRRTFRTWFLDVSKQGFGACYAHVLNMIIASVISRNIRGGDVELKDQCAWYGLSYLIDTTLGLILAIIFVRLLDTIANERDWVHLKHSGVYVGPHGLWTWALQVGAWIVILTIVKLIIYAFMWLCSAPLAFIGGLLFAPLQAFSIHFELVFVMILFPGLLNVIYFWIADSFLKAKDEHGAAHENDETGLEDKKETLLVVDAESEQRPPSDSDDNMSFGTYQPMPWSTLFGRGTSDSKINTNNKNPEQQQEVELGGGGEDGNPAKSSSSPPPDTALV